MNWKKKLVAGAITVAILLLMRLWGAATITKTLTTGQEQAIKPLLEQAAAAQDAERIRQAESEAKRAAIQKQTAASTALQPGQRCVAGKRLERINGEWRDAGSC